MLGHNELLMPDLFSCGVVSSNYSVNSGLRSSHALSGLSNYEHMLFVFIVRLRSSVLLLRILSSDKDLTPCLFLKTLLIQAFRSNQHADVVDSSILGDVDLLLNF